MIERKAKQIYLSSLWENIYVCVCFIDETGPNTEVIQGDYTSLIKEPDTDVKIICNRYQTGYGSISWYKDG